MPGPKSKISKSRRGMRRSHDALKSPTVHNCGNCGSMKQPHKVCLSCGYYDGREVLAARG